MKYFIKFKSLFIIFIIIITKGICFSQQTDSDLNPLREIPAVSALAKDTLVISMSRNFYPFTFINTEGKPAGIFVDIWNLWSEKTGQKTEFLPSTWNETLENIKNSNADIHSGLAVTHEREEWMIFSQELYENSFCFFFPLKQEKILSLSELSGEKIGVIQNSSQEEYLKKNYPDIELILFKSTQEAILSAKEGHIRAVADSYLSTSSDIMQLGLTGEFECSKEILYSKKFHAGVLKKNKELLAFVDKGFDSISNNELAEIEKRWILDPEKRYYRTLGNLRLTESEKLWIKEHKTVRIQAYQNFEPFGFIDPEGKPVGYTADYVRLIGSKIGINFKLIPVPMSDTDNMLKKGDLDIIYSYNIPGRKSYVNFSKPIIFATWGVIHQNNISFLGSFSVLKGRKVFYTKGLRSYEQIAAQYPEISLIQMENIEEALKAVSNSQADAYIGDMAISGYMIQKYGLTNLKISGVQNYQSEPLMFAIRKDWDEFVGIMNKAVTAVTQKEVDNLFNKWFPVVYESSAYWRLIFKWGLGIGGVLIVIIGITLYWNRRLAKEISERICAEELLRTSEELFRQSFENANVGVCLVGTDGRFIKVNRKLCEMFGYESQELEKMTVNDVIHPDSPEKSTRFIQHAVEGQISTDEFEKKYINRQNHIVWGRVSSSLIRDAAGNPIYFISHVRDITASKQAEEYLKLNEARLESLLRISQYKTDNTKDLLEYALDEAIILTGSKIGYIYYYNEERREFILNTWSKDVMKECRIIAPQTLYHIDKTGAWGEAVRERVRL